ncbi:aromatic-ring hydroxylase C-terminal domain-containing protein [Jiangella alkaliphila]|uniref:aromatic-ring hydroxylase C-terminal domain-containing protein n=1 Tax=Jiangella alkaliphila TaxID=419479 RepID=UPI00389AC891
MLDHTGIARRILSVGGTAAHLLVRPDGYIGYRGDADLSGVQEYLRRWLIPG